jgi:mono/diheme cytochrome c family protein
MLKYVLIILGLLVALTLIFAGVRGQTSRLPPVLLFDDMVDQPKYRNQGESAFFQDQRQMRLPAPGSVPWGRSAVQPDPSLLVNDPVNYQLKKIPLKLDYALLERGQQVFSTYCVVCHGAFGTGNGITTNYGQAPPANYHADRLRQATDGYLYQVITEGKGLMGPYGPSIAPEDRWAVVAYVRALQRAGQGHLQDVPENLREQLQKEP